MFSFFTEAYMLMKVLSANKESCSERFIKCWFLFRTSLLPYNYVTDAARIIKERVKSAQVIIANY